MKAWLSFFFLFLFTASGALAQTRGYNPDKTFDPTFLTMPGNLYRSGSGAPGPDYWQNQADYKINVSLNNKKHRISGSEVITYTNNSPDSLHFLWVQLTQNIYKKILWEQKQLRQAGALMPRETSPVAIRLNL